MKPWDFRVYPSFGHHPNGVRTQDGSVTTKTGEFTSKNRELAFNETGSESKRGEANKAKV